MHLRLKDTKRHQSKRTIFNDFLCKLDLIRLKIYSLEGFPVLHASDLGLVYLS